MFKDSSVSSDEGAQAGLTGRDRWLKKNTVEDVAKKKKTVKVDSAPVKPDKLGKEKIGKEKKLAFAVALDISEVELNRKILEVVAMRGRRNTDIREMILHLQVLSTVSFFLFTLLIFFYNLNRKFIFECVFQSARRFGPRCEIPALCHLMAAHVDMQRGMDDFMGLEDWRKCYGHLTYVVSYVLCLGSRNHYLLF
jgi:hypothetical protein